MSKKQEIVQALADLAKAMVILKERQEAIEQKLIGMGAVTVSVEDINKSFDRNKGWGTITGNVELTNYHNPTYTYVPVTIEDLKKMEVCFHEWSYRPVDDKQADEETSENLEKQMRYFLKKYLP